jgi:hypothetical protein
MKSQPPILLLAGSGFVVRNLLLGTFAEAVSKRWPLLVAVLNNDDPRLQELAREKNIELMSFPIDKNGNPGGLRQLTSWHTYMYQFKAVERANASLKMQTKLYEPSRSLVGRAFHQLLMGTGHVLKLAGATAQVEDRYLKAVEHWPISLEWRHALERVQPAAVVSSMLTLSTMRYHSFDLPAVVAARALGIPCGTLIQSWDNLSSKTAVLPPWLERYWSWSDWMTEELLTLNPRLRRDQVAWVGSPQFDFHLRPELLETREAYCQRMGLNPAQPFLVVGTGTAKWMPCEPPTVIELIEALARRIPPCQVLVRLHPKDDGKRWEEERARVEKMGAVIQVTAPSTHMDEGGFVPPKEFFRDQVNCLHHSAVVLNTASTLTVDASILDRPVICFGYDAVPDDKFPEGRALAYSQSTHYSPLVATGGVKVVHSLEHCVQTIQAYLDNPALDRAGRREIVARVMGEADGGAGERLAAEVLAMAERRLAEPKRVAA